jgi:tRNA pseudouridine38/39 synthase
MESLEGMLKKYKPDELIKEILHLSKNNPCVLEHFSGKNTSSSKNSRQQDTGKEVDFGITKNMAFKFMYNGKGYDGLVTQKDTKNTIEEHIFTALKKSKLIEDENSCNFARCGRTDAGVSSVGNVFSLTLRYKDGIDYIKILNNLLPKDIVITGQCEVDDSFDARFSCLYREYKYFFLKENMNMDKLQEGCKKLVGLHNFKNLCKLDRSQVDYQTKTYDRRIYEFRLERYDKLLFPLDNSSSVNYTNDYFDVYYVVIKGSAFLWHQVRCMMAILFLIGKGLEEVNILDKLFEDSGIVFNYEIASELPLILTDCQFEGISFTNSKENVAASYFELIKNYETNLIDIAMNTFTVRHFLKTNPVRGSFGLTEEEIVKCLENNFRRKKKYTQLLNHKTNRNKKNLN